MNSNKISTLIILVLFIAVCTFGQDPVDDTEVLRIDTQLIDVPVSVSDKTGRPVLKLKKDNFEVFEDGKKQVIDSFFATDEPFEVALFLDTSGSTRSELRLIKRAANMFVDSLRAGDRVALMAFETEVEKDGVTGVSRSFPAVALLSPLTDDRSKLKAALERLGTSSGTPYYDGLLRITEKVFGKSVEPRFRGRRALVALTDGVDSTSDAGYEEVSELVAESGITTYFVHIDTRQAFEDGLLGDCTSSTQFSKAQLKRYYDLFPKEFRVERVMNFCRLGDFERLDISKRLYLLAEDQMKAMAKKSGGRVFPVNSLTEARQAFRKVAADIGTSYSLGYYPSNSEFDGKYRKITVTTNGLPAGSAVRTRDGYTAPKKADN